jgi:phosphoribosylanthranilate isomerase
MTKGQTLKGTKIKVCGLTRWEDMTRLADLGVHYRGFIFYDRSPRFSDRKLDAVRVKDFEGFQKVGVFVNATTAYILEQKEKYGLDLVQLHGDESPGDCLALRNYLPVMKAFRLKTPQDLAVLPSYKEACDYFLFDTPGVLYGGNGNVFDWSLLTQYTGRTPFFLSGGIGPAETESLKAFAHPALHAVDINSRFETAPGKKNIDDIKRFLWDLNIS